MIRRHRVLSQEDTVYRGGKYQIRQGGLKDVSRAAKAGLSARELHTIKGDRGDPEEGTPQGFPRPLGNEAQGQDPRYTRLQGH